MNNKLALWVRTENGSYTEKEIKSTAADSDAYLIVKALSHISVNLTMLLNSLVNDFVNSQNIVPRLKKIDHVLMTLENASLGSKIKHSLLVKQSRLLIEQALNSQKKDDIEIKLNGYLMDVLPIIDECCQQATQLQLDSLRAITNTWSIQFERSRVLILGSQQPRVDLIEQQYFEHLYAQQGFNNQGSQKMIYYVEMLPEQLAHQTPLSLLRQFLAPIELNRRIAIAMLGDPNGMNKDVLGRFAKIVLQAKKVEDQEPPKCPLGYK